MPPADRRPAQKPPQKTPQEPAPGSAKATPEAPYRPGPRERTLRDADGRVIEVPAGWALLPPGDALLTRRVKALGPAWPVAEPVGRKLFSRGLWAPEAQLAAARAEVEARRADPAHARQLEAGRARRAAAQEVYVHTFEAAVLAFLAFPPAHAALAARLARAVAAHATPVGSGTVARTERIPVERRAEAAVIAWMRHQTTAYDDLQIPRVKGARREVRRMLAGRSRALLDRYRRGGAPDPACPLRVAVDAEAPLPAPGGTDPDRDRGSRPTGGTDPDRDRGSRPTGGTDPDRDRGSRPTGGTDPDRDRRSRPTAGTDPDRDRRSRPTGGTDPDRDRPAPAPPAAAPLQPRDAREAEQRAKYEAVRARLSARKPR
jgi:hypothetical protein